MIKNRIKVLYALIIMSIIVIHGCSTLKSSSKPNNQKTKGTQEIEEKTTEINEGEDEGNARVSEFILGTGDKVEIIVYRNDDLKRTVQVDPSGNIMYPLVGDIKVAGLSIFELRNKIRDGLAKYIIDPQVTVGVVATQSQKIIVLGEVKTPGFFQAESSINVLEAISRAGGFTLDGKKQSVLLIRGGMKKPVLMSLNLEKALKEGDLTQNVILQKDDIIYVPRTTISDVNRFFAHFSTIVSPLLQLETGYYIGQKISEGGGGSTAVAP